MGNSKSENGVNRRKFIKSSFLSGLGALVSNKTISQIVSEDKSTVVVVEDSNATSGTAINASTVQKMVDDGILALTGLDDVGEAWLSLMPDLTSSSVIAIKVNCRSDALPTHPEVTYAVTDGLARMIVDGASFSENNIHIYDNEKAYLSESDYTLNTSSQGVQCYMATSFSSTSYSINGVSQRVCTLVHDTADYLINIGVLKNHYSMAGVTLCMKNHFGTIDQPRNMHINAGDPYIGALNAIDPIKNKQIINILDGLFGAAEGGPYGAATFVANKIIMSSDPVAVDYLGREILTEQGSSTVGMASYVDSAANYGIGTNDPEEMDIINISDSVTGLQDQFVEVSSSVIQNFPNPFSDYTNFSFSLEKESEVTLEIFTALGIKVITLVRETLPAGQHNIVWHGESGGGIEVQKGMYVARFTADDHSTSIAIMFN